MLTFKQLQSAVEYATNIENSSFYREFYKLRKKSDNLPIQTWKDWNKIPFISKDILLETSIKDRSFLPFSKLDTISTSSGTVGKLPLFSPRQPLGDYTYRKNFHDFKNPTLSFVNSHQHKSERFPDSPQTILIDFKNIEATARLARIAKVDSMYIHGFLIASLGEQLKKEGYTENIRLIEITDLTTKESINFIKETFPNAKIISSYGASDVEHSPMGVPCNTIQDNEPFEIYHANRGIFFEIIDPETEQSLEIKKGVVGELVITSYFPDTTLAFPLIRYRIGDMVKVVEELCHIHKTWSFTVLGRKELEFIKLPNGILRADEIASVLRSVSNEVSDEFEVYYNDEVVDGKIKTKIELLISPRKPSINLEDFSRKIEKIIRISADSTFEEGVKKGFCLPITCTILERQNRPLKKALRIHKRELG